MENSAKQKKNNENTIETDTKIKFINIYIYIYVFCLHSFQCICSACSEKRITHLPKQPNQKVNK